MQNPLVEQIEEISSKTIGEMKYHNKQVVLLEDAITALEDLEVKLWGLFQTELAKAKKSETVQ